ncbi:hypothetical protein RRG08_062829 [Elysia crispata]|uniref:Uncharacterized protein n=1 Tax=Elysia crispata TaxID=231223 RepID=A0AAE0ZY71_9GAST|nr:hypothetical protein RRG08_062829 [Elysia crispata]
MVVPGSGRVVLQVSRSQRMPCKIPGHLVQRSEAEVTDDPIDAWRTEDFYLDGAGYFIHKDCDKDRGTDIVYVMLKNGRWDIVTKTRIPTLNRNGKAVNKLIIDAAPMLDFFRQTRCQKHAAQRCSQSGFLAH